MLQLGLYEQVINEQLETDVFDWNRDAASVLTSRTSGI
jgi:hypothetical protein